MVHSADEPAARPYDEPEAAELADVLAEHLAGLPISDVVVERVAGVGDLKPAVAAPGRSEQLAAADGGREVRRPRLRAGARAGALAAGILRERVEREAAAVEQDPAVRGAVDGDGAAGRGGR